MFLDKDLSSLSWVETHTVNWGVSCVGRCPLFLRAGLELEQWQNAIESECLLVDDEGSSA